MPAKKKWVRSAAISRFLSPNDNFTSTPDSDVLRISSDFSGSRRFHSSCFLCIVFLESLVILSYRYLSVPPMDFTTLATFSTILQVVASCPEIWLIRGLLEAARMQSIIEVDRKARTFRLISATRRLEHVRKQQVIPFGEVMNIKRYFEPPGEGKLIDYLSLEMKESILPLIQVDDRDWIYEVDEELKRFLLGPYLATLSAEQRRDADNGYWWFTFCDVDVGIFQRCELW